MTRRLLLSYLSITALVLLVLELPLGVTFARAEHDRLVAAVEVGAPQAGRITLTPPVLRNAAALLLLVSGAAKAEALKRALATDGSVDDCPARILKETRGTVVVIADREAAQLL